MNKELTQRLVRRFPVLYQDYNSPMSQTCMCWGFDHGDGWFEIIWQLSLAIEEELGYSWLRTRWFLLKKSFFRFWNKSIYALSPVRLDKQVQAGSGTTDDPYRWVVVEKAPRDWLAKTASILISEKETDGIRSWRRTIENLGFKAFVVWPDTGFAVQQVKEKYGTLRFYSPGNDAIHKYVWLAQRLSSVTCEDCGKPGTANASGWLRTQCDDCRTSLTQNDTALA